MTPEEKELNTSAKRVLLADSDGPMRNVMRNFLAMQYNVDAAASSDEAGELIKRNRSYDLVLVDTQLTPINGITFSASMREMHSQIEFALMTKTRVEDLLPALNKYRLHNVLVKSSPFQFDDFYITVDNLLYPSRAMGLRRYLRGTSDIREAIILQKTDRQPLLEDAASFFRRYRPYDTDVSGIRLAFEELINNALFHAFRRKTGGEKYRAGSFDSLESNEQITIEYGRDNTYLGCSVTDNQGTLDIAGVMLKMDRQISMEGLLDENGRGLYLTRTLCDRMIINVKPGKATQIILLFAHRPMQGPKPLLANLIADRKITVLRSNLPD